MLSEAELKELNRCLQRYQRGILTALETIPHLGAIARPHNLDLVLDQLPPELVEPVRLQTSLYQPVRAIGYWRSLGEPLRASFGHPSDSEFPDPRNLVCLDEYPADREVVVRYLREGRDYTRWRGLSYCRFRCGAPSICMGSRCLTDGKWVWPEGLSHYIEAHSVLLPDEFLQTATAAENWDLGDKPMPSSDTQGMPDYHFWIAWGRSADGR